VFVVAILLMPKSFFAPPVVPYQPPPADPVRFVSITPRIDRTAPPKPMADPSDKDRRSATVEPAPKPENTAPVSHGNTSEKTESTPAARAAGPETPQPATPAPAPQPQPPDPVSKLLPDSPVAAKPATGGSLGDQLRNLTKVLQNATFDNPTGGQSDKYPDIQFDSRGVDFGPWIARFRAQVMSNWFVPETAMYLKGHVVLQFIVHRDGTITDLKIVQPSTVDSFTTSSFNAMKTTAIQHTQRLPDEYPTDQVLFTVTFFYNERIPH